MRKIWRYILKLFSWFKSGRRKSSRQSITQNSSGDNNRNIGLIRANILNFFELQLKQAPPDAKFRLPEPFYPEKLENFTRRNKELVKLAELLIDKQDLEAGKNRAIIYGIPGVGKSALACYFAYFYYYERNQFPDGVYGLRVDRKGEDTQAIARKFANLCGENINIEDERNPNMIMQDLFADRRALLILDNAEHRDISSLFPSSSKCAVIVTTRNRSLPDVFKISHSISPNRQIQLEPFEEEDSLELLEQFIDKKRITVEQDYARNIIRKVGNLPLALQVVGVSLSTGIWKKKKQSLKEYADALEEEKFELLQSKLDIHLNVKASFSLSLKNLSSEEQEFFACLSACAESGFSLLTASAVGNYTKSKTEIYLNHLVEFSLVNLAETEQERYILHTLIYEFAKYKLEQNQSLQLEAKNRHASHFLEFVRNNDLNDGGVLTDLDQNIEDIILTAEWLVNQETDDYDFILLLGDFFEQFKYYQQAIDIIREFRLVAEKRHNWAIVVELSSLQVEFFLLKRNFQQAKDILESIPEAINRIEQPQVQQSCEAIRLRSLSSLYKGQNKLAQAEQTLNDSYQILVYLGERDRQAEVLNQLGEVLQSQGRFSEAVEILKQSLDIYEESANLRGLVKVLTNLGIALYRQDKFEEALYFLERSRLIAENQLKDRGRSSMILANLGLVYQGMQQFDKAEKNYLQSYFIAKKVKDFLLQNLSLKYLLFLFQTQGRIEQSWSLVQELDDDKTIVIALNQLAKDLLEKKKFNEAVEASTQGIKIAEYCQTRIQKIYGYNILASIFKEQGNLEKAESILHRCISLSEELEAQQSLAISLNTLGGILKQRGNLEEAESILCRCISLREDLQDQQGLAISLNTLGGILQQRGNLEEAESILRRCISLSEELEDKKQLVISLNTLGSILQQRGNLEEAESILRRCISLSEELKDKSHLAKVHTSLGKIFIAQESYEQAVEELKKAFTIDEELKDKKDLVIIVKSLSWALNKLHRSKEAVKFYERAIKIAPKNDVLLKLKDKIYKPPNSVVKGVVKSKKQEYGFIYSSELNSSNGADIFFHKYDIEAGIFAQLRSGTLVEVEVINVPKGYGAKNIKIIKQPVKFKNTNKQKNSNTKFGVVTELYTNKIGNYYGFISPEDNTEKIYFHEKRIGTRTFFKLRIGTNVKAEVKHSDRGFIAQKINIID